MPNGIKPWSPGKHKPTDLSRFSECHIKAPMIADLMANKEFRDLVEAFDGRITDQWVIEQVILLKENTKTTPDLNSTMVELGLDVELSYRMRRHAFYCERYRKLKKQFPEYASLYSEIKHGE
ncbi:MAG: hypothetical protein PUF04_09545 [bacterium]|nr:hypothetical protein [bacterium]